VARALETDPGIEVVGSAKSALEARDLIKQVRSERGLTYFTFG
jgi:chemotaxis response regulator CheB